MKDTADARRVLAADIKGGRKVQSLATRVLELQTIDKLRLAAELLEQGQITVALPVAQRAVEEIQLVCLFPAETKGPR